MIANPVYKFCQTGTSITSLLLPWYMLPFKKELISVSFSSISHPIEEWSGEEILRIFVSFFHTHLPFAVQPTQSLLQRNSFIYNSPTLPAFLFRANRKLTQLTQSSPSGFISLTHQVIREAEASCLLADHQRATDRIWLSRVQREPILIPHHSNWFQCTQQRLHQLQNHPPLHSLVQVSNG